MKSLFSRHNFFYVVILSFLFSCINSEQLTLGKFHEKASKEGEEKSFEISVAGEKDIKKIFIDIITYVGEVEVNTDNINKTELIVSQYISINKIYLSLKTFPNYESLHDFYFSVKTISDAYYIVHYSLGKEDIDDSLITNELKTGMSYLVTIDPKIPDGYNIANKVIRFKNEKFKENIPIMTSFFSLNCKTEIGQIYKDKNNCLIYAGINHFSHDIIDPKKEDQKDRYTENIEYRINITENDPSQYEGKLCKLYVSSIEVSQNHQDQRDILIPDNILQQVMFGNGVNHVSYKYPHVNFDNNLIIKFYPKHRAQYKVSFYYEDIKIEKDETIVANHILFLESKNWKDSCKGKDYCKIQLDITLEKTKEVEEPVLEFSIEQNENNIVSYIPKNHFNLDYIQKRKPQYYYTEIGKFESGYIMTNFLRGNGNVYARIVEKDITEIGGNWRGKYFLPDQNNSIKNDEFNKQIEFSTNEKQCLNGCYLIIKIVSLDNNNPNLDTNYQYSIIIQTHEKGSVDNKQMPIISIFTDQYIVGNMNNFDNIYQFYSVYLNSNAEQVLIDFQSDSNCLYINVGTEKPNKTSSHFQISPGKSTLYPIPKSKILDKAKNIKGYSNFDGLKNIQLTIGVWKNNSESLDPSFAFNVRLENGNNLDIYRVNSDQKVLCKTRMVSEKNYRCVYAIVYDYVSNYNALFVYPVIEKKSSLFDIYGKTINQLDYEINANNQLKNLIPSKENKDYTNQGLNMNYLLVNDGLNENQYLLVSVETSEETLVELISTIYILQDSVTINPDTPQILVVNPYNEFMLKFPSNKKEMVNIRSIEGFAEVHWASNPKNVYYLRGRDDILSITTEDSDKNRALLFNFKKFSNENCVLYVDSEIRSINSNFDELILDSSNYYIYSKDDFPFSYYTSFDESNIKENEFYDIFFSLDLLETNEINYKLENNLFLVTGGIISQSLVWKSKRSINIPTVNIPINGNYDPSLKTGFIRITNEDIKRTKFNSQEQPYLFLSIKKNDNTKKEFKRVSLDMTAVKSTLEFPVSELSYHFGKLGKNETERKYKLKTNKLYNYLNLKFSCSNNDALIIKIENKNLNKEKQEYGRIVYSLKLDKDNSPLILVIQKKANNKENDEFFTFQYKYSNESYNDAYRIYSNSDLQVGYENNKNKKIISYNISLNPINNYKKYNITYIVKGMANSDNKYRNEDLSLRFDQSQNSIEYFNPEINKDSNKLEFTLNNIPEFINCIQVIAQIKDKENIEYLSYSLYIKEEGNPSNNSKNKYLALFIVVGLLLFAIIIALIAVIIIFNNKNKDLLDKVNKVSFQEERGSKQDGDTKDGLLYNNEENVLG